MPFGCSATLALERAGQRLEVAGVDVAREPEAFRRERRAGAERGAAPALDRAAAIGFDPVVVPLRRVLKKCEVINARVVSLDHAARTARLDPIDALRHE